MNPLTLAYINSIAMGRSQRAKSQAKSQLGQLGLLLHFPHLSQGWIPAVPPQDLTPTWQAAGLPVNGVGYSTIGTIIPGSKTSGRFWPTSPYYQARMGGYLFERAGDSGTKGEDQPDIEKFLPIVVADQSAWLKVYGCPAPQAKIKPHSFQILAETKHQDFPAWGVCAVISTNSDVGAANRSLNSFIAYRTYEIMFQRFGGIHLPTLCTLPPIWPLASYHALELDFKGIIVRVGGQGHWCLFYCCGARWEKQDYFGEIGDPTLEALRQARIVSI